MSRVGWIVSLVTAGVVLVVAGVVVFVNWPEEEVREPFTVSGMVSVMRPVGVGEACDLPSSYADIRSGAAVTISDGDGAVLAAGQLAPGAEWAAGECRFGINVPDVPAGHGRYGVKVADRPVLWFSESSISTQTVVLPM
jgi:hypothetical protein